MIKDWECKSGKECVGKRTELDDLCCGRKQRMRVVQRVRWCKRGKRKAPDMNYYNFSLINLCKCSVSFPFVAASRVFPSHTASSGKNAAS